MAFAADTGKRAGFLESALRPSDFFGQLTPLRCGEMISAKRQRVQFPN
jgi:hypothetical protein